MKRHLYLALTTIIAVSILQPLFAGTVTVNIGDDLRALAESNPEGTVFLVKAGLHRGIASIQLKADQQVIGELGANGERLTIFSGAKLLSNWQKEGDYWVHDVSNVQIRKRGHHYKHEPFGVHNNDLYMDDVFLREMPTKKDLDEFVWVRDVWPIGVYEQLDTAKALMEHGTWWFDTANGKAYMKDDPTGHKMEISSDGGLGFGGGAQGAVVKNFIAEKYATGWQGGPIGAAIGGNNNARDTVNGEIVYKYRNGVVCPDYLTKRGMIVENCEVRWNHAGGIGFNGCAKGFVMRNNYVHHNGQIGVKLVGTVGAVIEGNEIAYNCFERTIGFVPSENGGTKFSTRSDSTIIRGNYVHHNWDNGIWFDGYNMHAIIEGNVTEKNTGAGVFLEIGEPESEYMKVRHNIARRNGYCGWFYAGQIQVSVTRNAEIYNNVLEVDWTQGGHAFVIIYQIDDGGRGAMPPTGTHFYKNHVMWNYPNICGGDAPWQSPIAGNTKHGWGASIWGGSLAGANADLTKYYTDKYPDSSSAFIDSMVTEMKEKRLRVYESQRSCVDTCSIKFENNYYHLRNGAAEAEEYKYWRWPAAYPDTNDYESDGTIDYDYDMGNYSLAEFQATVKQDLGSTLDSCVDTNTVAQLKMVLDGGASEALVTTMAGHFDLTLAEVKAYTLKCMSIDARYAPKALHALSKKISALYTHGMLKLRLPTEGAYTVALFDARGRVILKEQFTVAKGKSLKTAIDVRRVPAGIYTLRALNGKSEQTQKIAFCK